MSNDQQHGTLKKAYDKARMHGLYATSAVLDNTIGILNSGEQVAPSLIERGNKIWYKYHPQALGNLSQTGASEEAEAKRKALVAELAAIDADREAHPLREAQQIYSWLMKPDHFDPDGDAGVVAGIAGYLKQAQQTDPTAKLSLASLDASGSQSDWDVYQKLLRIIENDYKRGLAYQQGKLDKAQEDMASASDGVAYFQGLLDKGAVKAFEEMFGEGNVPATPQVLKLRVFASSGAAAPKGS